MYHKINVSSNEDWYLFPKLLKNDIDVKKITNLISSVVTNLSQNILQLVLFVTGQV